MATLGMRDSFSSAFLAALIGAAVSVGSLVITGAGGLQLTSIAANSLLKVDGSGIVGGSTITDNSGIIEVGNTVAATVSIAAASATNITTGPAINENGWTTMTAAAGQDVTNLQDQDATGFSFSVVGGTTNYYVECTLMFGATNAANDAEFRFAVTAGTMRGFGNAVGVSAALASATTLISAVAAATTNQTPVGTDATNANTPTAVRVEFAFQPTNNGTFKLQFGNNVTGAGIVTRLAAGSRCRWRRGA